MSFLSRYGPWALVAGASEGIGAAFAHALADRGLSVVLVARRPGPLAELAAALPTPTLTVAADLSTVEGLATLDAATADREVGLLVCNAGYALGGPLLDAPEADLLRVVDTNVRAPLLLARRYAPAMVRRGRGGLVVVSSLAGQQGTARLATYAASKAFGTVLAEGLWAELRPAGVHVLACLAGAVSTPGYDAAMARPAPGTVAPAVVAEAALRALGRRPHAVPGALMRVSAPVLARLPRRAAIGLMSRSYRGVGG
jgi:short-subunit dehydrogenase